MMDRRASPYNTLNSFRVHILSIPTYREIRYLVMHGRVVLYAIFW